MATATMMVMRVKRVGEISVPEPAYQSDHAAGLDLYAAIPGKVVLSPGERELIPTGYAIALPSGHEGQVRPRSGLALHHGVTVLNSPGTVDEDFRGEIGVVLINHGKEDFTIEPKMRVAQLVVAPVTRVTVDVVDELDDTSRGAGGYGSTGA
jgi:dUTP pyrophosphatase